MIFVQKLICPLKQAFTYFIPLILISMLIPTVSVEGKFKPSLPYFTVQFYRIKVHPTLKVENIEQKNHFYVLSGRFENYEVLYYLSRNILNSRLLKPFNFQDSLIKVNGKKFKLFLKTQNVRKKKQKLFISITTPNNLVDLTEDKKISGECFPNGKRINLLGDLAESTVCQNGKWSIKTKVMSPEQLYIFAQIADSSGGVFFDGRSFR